MSKLRVAMIGLGNVSVVHLHGYREATRVEVVAACDPRTERVQAMQREWGFRGYATADEMLRRERPDIACVLAPAAAHRATVELSAASGAHVLCEKPIALTTADAEAMAAACERSGVKFCYAESYRYLGPVRIARDMIRAGALGDIILLLEVAVTGRGPECYHGYGPEHYPLGGPGGPSMGLFDHGIHLVDTFRWLTGSEVESVYGRGAISGQPPGVEHLTMHFRNGALGQLVYSEATFAAELPGEGLFSWDNFSWEAADGVRVVKTGPRWDPHPGGFRVYGTRGALRVFHHVNRLFHCDAEGAREIKVLDSAHPGSFGRQIDAFAESITEGRDPPVTADDGMTALKVILATYESAARNETIRL